MAEANNPSVSIPAWRPGRYQLQNYAANIRDCEAEDQNGDTLPISKTSRNTWQIEAGEGSEITFQYVYYCRQMDAGGCWSDPSLFYINPIACLMYVEQQEDKACSVSFQLPEGFIMGTGLPFHENKYIAESYSELSDSPVMASSTLTTFTYSAAGIPFYIHSTVDASSFPETLLSDFGAFTRAQIKDFGSFPANDYHFLLLMLPYQHYHGVEHRNSTVICLGPASEIKEHSYPELAGICSHELLHVWNICKIRPEEMLPYDLSKEQYFTTGFVAEGFTTYLGDHYLAQSYVFPPSWYEHELNTLLKRHFYSFGNTHLSVADSSKDLWIDGYEAGIPNRKVSIYVKGAMIAFLMDTAIREISDNARNLKTLLKELWDNYNSTGKGYSEQQIEELFHSYTNNEYREVYPEWIHGKDTLMGSLLLAFTYLEYEIDAEHHGLFLAGNAGILHDAHYTVLSLDPESPYLKHLSKGDKLLSVDGIPMKECSDEFLQTLTECVLEVSSGVRKWSMLICFTDDRYFKTFQIRIPEGNSRKQFM